MARQYLAEGVLGAVPFRVDRTKPLVTEHTEAGGRPLTRIPGRFSVCDCVNGNRRKYSKRVWEKNLAEGSTLRQLISENAAFGLLEHPKDGVVGLNHPDISHRVVAVEMREAADESGRPRTEVHGAIEVYEDLPAGQKLLALIRSGYDPLVSSRGFGSLKAGADGVDEVQEDFVCEGWDCVRTPSFVQAQLKPARESETPASVEKTVTESTTGTPQPTSPAAKAEVTPPAVNESDRSTPSVTPNMDINEIKSRLAALQGLDPQKLDARRISESVTEAAGLHQAIAEYGAADPKRSWEATQLHRTVEGVESALATATTAPRKQAQQLGEHNRKLMQVIEATAATALTYKKRLGEATKSGESVRKFANESVRKGKGWHKIAEDRRAKLERRENQFETACEALDLLKDRYHTDTTALARRVLSLEFAEQLAGNADWQKRLNEATRLKHVIALREEIEGKKPEEGKAPGKEAMKTDKTKGMPSPEAAAVAGEGTGKVTNEAKAGEAKPAAKVTEAKAGEAKPAETKPGFSANRDPYNITESVGLVRRLSPTASTATK